MDPVIKLDNVSCQFGATRAVDQVSFEVPPGVVFALLGENGAGKTTTIRMMLGLQAPGGGSLQVLGRDSGGAGTEIRRQTGYVPEQPALYEWMTVAEIGWFTAGFYPDGFEDHYRKLVKQFELPLDRKIRQLSKGMRAKVSLSLAMAHQPGLLILDEPTSGLDTLVRRQFLESMVDVAADGHTVFLSSHQIPEVERVADIVAIMHQGRLLVCEPLEQLKSRLEFWTIALAEGATTLPPTASPEFGIAGFDQHVLDQRQTGRQVRLTMAGPDPEWLWKLRDHPAIAEIELHVPTLEEIFVTCLQQSEKMQAGFLNPRTADAGSGQTS